jgi:general stress protein 26
MVDKAQNDNEARQKVWDMIKDIRVAQMITKDASGRLYARPMVAQQDKFHEELWFFTEADSPKIEEIARDQNVLLSYSDPKNQNYVSINGKAEIVTDRDTIHSMWNEHLRTWFPKGKDDPNIALIKVDVQQAEYWDSSSSAFIYAVGYVKAVVTGKQPDAGDNRKVSF